MFDKHFASVQGKMVWEYGRIGRCTHGGTQGYGQGEKELHIRGVG